MWLGTGLPFCPRTFVVPGNSDQDPFCVTYMIPGNDDTRSAMEVYCDLMQKAVIEGKYCRANYMDLAEPVVDMEALERSRAEREAEEV